MKVRLSLFFIAVAVLAAVSCGRKPAGPVGPTAVVKFDSGEQLEIVNWTFEYAHEYVERVETNGYIWESGYSITMKTNDCALRLRLNYDETLTVEADDLAEIRFEHESGSVHNKVIGAHIITKSGEVHDLVGSGWNPLNMEHKYFWPEVDVQESRQQRIALTAEENGTKDESGKAPWYDISYDYMTPGETILSISFLAAPAGSATSSE